jgi:TolB-like protein
MTDPDTSSPAPRERWFAEMKRRRVFRVIAVYGAVSFGVIELADLIFPLVRLPEWAVGLVLWLTILGFPIAVVLAWAFEMTPDGVRRTEAASQGEINAIVAAPALARWSPGVMALAGIALLGVGFYGGSRSSTESREGSGEGSSSAATRASSASSVANVAGPGLTYVDPSEDPRPAIAVLPFADMSPEGNQEYFSDGISLEITTVLSRIRALRIAPWSSAFTYKDLEADLRLVGAELGVPYLLGGTVRRIEDQLRIDVELVSATDRVRIWSQTYDRRLENVFAIQTEIAEAIADELRVPLGLSAGELVIATLDMEAYDLYLNGRAALRRRGPGIGEAVRLFEAAVALDSAWAPAWGGLAEAYTLAPLYTGLGGESTDSAVWARNLSAAEEAATHALTLDPQSASAQVALGGVYMQRWEWPEAERAFQRALELDPDSEEAHTHYSELLWGMGRMDESMRESGRALALERTPIRLDIHGFTLYMNGLTDEAEATLEEGLAKDPEGEVHFLRAILADLFLFEGRYLEAVDRFGPYLPDGYREMGEALETGDATLLPERAGRGFPQTLVLLGEPDRALDVLEETVFAMPYRVQFVLWDPILEPIWRTDRFQNVILPRLRLDGAVPSFAAPAG